MINLSALKNCNICPRKCGVDRLKETGYCRSGINPIINTWQKHFGEEPAISGNRGSGTIFFSNCNLKCIFCQNFRISQLGYGREYSIEELSEMMMSLQESGAHNINFVTPTHFSLQIYEAILLSKEKGLKIPIVWNSNAFENVETLRKFKGLVEIYMPDFKYFDSEASFKYSDVKGYPDVAKKAILEMHKQVGYLELNENGVAEKGVLIRLLLLPGNINNIKKILEWIAENLGTETYISLMSQYYPSYKADEFPELSRSITHKEYKFAKNIVESLGFENGYFQDVYPTPEWTPDFKK